MKKVGIKYGVICGLVYIIFGMAALLVGAESQTKPLLGLGLGLATVVATFFVIFYGVREFRDQVNGGILAIGDAVKLGGMIALIASILSALFNLLYHYVIDPGYMERVLETTREAMEERGLSDEQIESMTRWSGIMQNPILGAALTLVWYTLWGFIKGLVSGAILKKEPSPVL